MTKRGLLIRGILFFGVIAYVAYDFISKEKYIYLLPLALGSIAFAFIIRMMRNKEE